MTVRAARESDAFALGLLVTEALDHAPSSEFDAAELATAPQDLGRELVLSAITSGAWLLAAELRYELIGAARLTPREFKRSRHVADVTIVVHPRARRQGCGGELLDAMTAMATDNGKLRKLTSRVAADDLPLRSLLASRGWQRERLERGALWGDRGQIDVEVMALHLC